MSHDTSSNPILSAYKTYYTSTPLATRLTLNAATVFYILSYFIDTQQILSCIPSQAIFHFQFYRFFFSPFLCDGIVTLIFSYISLLHHGLRLELSMGSTNFAAMVICLSLMPSVIISIFGILSQNSFVMSVPMGGIWIIVFAVMAVECSYAPRGETRRFFMADVPTRYYPCVLLGLVTLFSGGNFPYTYVISVILGYLYGFGKLDWLKIGYERRKELDANVLRKFASMQGFTPGPSTDHWSMIDRTVGILGIWNNSRAGGVSDTNERRNDGHQDGWQPTLFRRPSDDQNVPNTTTSLLQQQQQQKTVGIAGKGHRLGGREGFTDIPSSSSSSRFTEGSSSRKHQHQHQIDRDAMLAAAERRAAAAAASSSSLSKSKHEEESNIENV